MPEWGLRFLKDGNPETWALFGWLAPSQPAVLFSHISSASATSHQSASSIFLS
jgi:hypothetical protein